MNTNQEEQRKSRQWAEVDGWCRTSSQSRGQRALHRKPTFGTIKTKEVKCKPEKEDAENETFNADSGEKASG